MDNLVVDKTTQYSRHGVMATVISVKKDTLLVMFLLDLFRQYFKNLLYVRFI